MPMSRFSKLVLTLALSGLAVISPLAALSYSEWIETVPDNAGIRVQLIDVIGAPLSELASRRARSYSQVVEPTSVRLEVTRNNQAGYTYIAFVNGENGEYPVDGAGSVVIRRNNRDGAFSQVKVFLKREPSIYMRISPAPSGSELSIFLMDDDHPLYQNLHLPVSIQQTALMSVRKLLEMTEGRVGWSSILDVPSAYYFSNVNLMISEIRKALPGLPDAEDGAMDDDGNLVRISTLGLNRQPGFNCSGFVKWIADGLYRPVTGSWLKIDDLKRRQFEARGDKKTEDYEVSRDPFFGLDWTRNIAAKLSEARGSTIRKVGFAAQDKQSVGVSSTVEASAKSSGPTISIMTEETWDVRDAPFLSYVEDRGYRVKDLKSLMYTLALKDPDYFYLGAINGNWGSQPVLLQYYHIVSIFPRISESGRFEPIVFERNVESSIDSLIRRYPNEYIHLIRIKASKDFQAPVIQ